MIDKLNKSHILQISEYGGSKRTKAINSVAIPLFNKPHSLIDKIIAWLKVKFSTADTKAFLTALGKGINSKQNKISKLKDNETLNLTFNVPKTNKRFDRLFVTITLEKSGGLFKLKYKDKVIAENLELNELKTLQKDTAMLSRSQLQSVKGLVDNIRAIDSKSKAAIIYANNGSTEHPVEFKSKMEYDITAYAQHNTTDEGLQKKITHGLQTLSSFGYDFSNQISITDKNGYVKHEIGKVKFAKAKIAFADKKINLRDQGQLNALCQNWLTKPQAEQEKLLQAIEPIISEETKESMQAIIGDLVTNNLRQKFEENHISLNRTVEDVEARMFPTATTILAENLENLTKNGDKLYENKIQPALQKIVDVGNIKDIAPKTPVTFSLIKTNKNLAKAMLSIFAKIEIKEPYDNVYSMQKMLEAIDQELPVGSKEGLSSKLKELKDLGFDMSASAEGEMRGITLLNAWNKYKKNNPSKNLWQFLTSVPSQRNTEEVKEMQVVCTSVKLVLTEIEQIFEGAVEFFGLNDLALDMVCEAAVQLHNSKTQHNLEPLQPAVAESAYGLDKLFSEKFERVENFQVKNQVNEKLLEGVKFHELSEQFTTYAAISNSEAYKVGDSLKSLKFIMGDTHAAYGYHLFTFLMIGLKKYADINQIISQEELLALNNIMGAECRLEIDEFEGDGMQYDHDSQLLVAGIFNKISKMCKESPDQFAKLFDKDALQTYMLLGDNIFDRKMSPLIFEPFFDFMLTLREKDIIPPQILGNHDVIPVDSTQVAGPGTWEGANPKDIIVDRQFLHDEIGKELYNKREFKDRILEKQKRYIKLNTFVVRLEESDTYISHAAILEDEDKNKNYGLYLGKRFELHSAEALENLNQTLKESILKVWGNPEAKYEIAKGFTEQRVHGDGYCAAKPLNRNINQIAGHDGSKLTVLPEQDKGFYINLNCDKFLEGKNKLQDGNNNNTYGIWLFT